MRPGLMENAPMPLKGVRLRPLVYLRTSRCWKLKDGRVLPLLQVPSAPPACTELLVAAAGSMESICDDPATGSQLVLGGSLT
jgi:hypothetical protein